MAIANLHDAFVEELKDLYHAEKQLVKALPKLAKKAGHASLKAAFEEHLEQTQEHVARLEQVFELLGKPARGKVCEAMKGLIEEGDEIAKEDADQDVKDAMLIGAAQKVEHYEIAGYGTLAVWAKTIGLDRKVVDLLKQTIAEEKATDEKLTKLAETGVNVAATAGESGRK